jgi:hypothetical protein
LDLALLDPMVEAEFRLLKATVLTPTNLQFDGAMDLRFPDGLTTMEEAELQHSKVLPSITPAMEIFPFKEDLRFDDELTLSSLHILAAACAEGDIKATKAQLASMPGLSTEIAEMSKLRLTAPALVFEGKEVLKRRVTPILIFRPTVKRALAIAAVVVLGVTIWQPWSTPVVINSGTASNGMETPTEASQTELPKQGDLASDQVIQTQSESNSKNSSNIAPKNKLRVVEPSHEDVAIVVPILPIPPIEEEVPVIRQLQEEENQIAQQPVPILPYTPPVPNSQRAAAPQKRTDEPITVLAFIGDKIEEKFEQSPVYSFLDKKKKEIFDSEDKKESLRYERVSTAEGVKQKLVLWGMELNRSKRKR